MPDAKVIEALPDLIDRLKGAYPNARYELNWETPLQLLVATILAAQCTDERVNQVTPGLFAKYPDAEAYARADMAQLEEDLKPTGFYRQKAKTVQAVCQALVERFGGEVPASMEDMVTLPGVARKTANVVLNTAFAMPTGVIVDTHVHRVSQRLGLTDQKRPEKIELDLMNIVPKKEWIFFGPAMVLLGRYTCTFHAPRCPECIMNDLCPKRGVGAEADGASPEELTGAEQAPDQEEDSTSMAAKKTTKSKAAPAKKTKAPAKAPAKAAAAPAPAKAPAPAPVGLEAGLPADWQAVLAGEFKKPYWKQLSQFVAKERQEHQVFPPEPDVFNAFKATPYEDVKVLLLGQDPYHDDGQAHGMCFSVQPGVKPPPSLVNIFKELEDDVGAKAPSHGYLVPWAKQGVMLLNAVLTVRAHEAASHKEKGWETFTDSVIMALNARKKPVVFLLWGAYAQKKAALIDSSRHRVLAAAHPSPLSAKKFFGSKPFSSANKALKELGQEPVNWQLPAQPAEDAPGTRGTRPAAAPAALPVPAQPAAARTATPAARPTAPAAPAVVVKEPPTVLQTQLPADWQAALAAEFTKPYFKTLDKFLTGERKDANVLPAEADVLNAFKYTPLDRVRVVLLGQEPPVEERLADGLAYSIKPDARLTPALQTMFRELRDDLGCRLPVSGSLVPWAKQGVLLLNAILTVRSGKPNAHKDKGWETFTDAVLKVLNERKTPIVFALWGIYARRKGGSINDERHVILTNENPGVTPEKFLGSRPFSAINDALELRGQSAVYWQLPYV
jgi:uracil-DNA glycosylase